MTATRSTYIFSIAAFLLGFSLGGLSLHVASAQGLFGLKTSITQIGSALVEMEKNVDALQPQPRRGGERTNDRRATRRERPL